MPNFASLVACFATIFFFLISQSVSQTNNGTLIWTPCSNFSAELSVADPSSSPPNITCYTFEVPLDWHNASAGNARLAVAKLNATGERKGVVFTNPGGPGSLALSILLLGGVQREVLSDLNTQFDIITWDPRGVGLSFPGTFEETYATPAEYALYWNGTFEVTGIDYTGNFTNQRDIDDLYAVANFTDQKYRQFSQKLIDQYGDLVKYCGTVANARDMLALADAFDTPGAPVNYWGFSYGTVLGSYFANLFPDRVGRMIWDGVVNVATFSENEPFRITAGNWESTDEAFGGVANACAAAGPSVCSLTREGWTGADVVTYLQSALASIHDFAKAHPEEANLLTSHTQITSGMVRNALLLASYGSIAGASLPIVLNNIIGQGFLSTWSNFTNGSFVYPPSASTQTNATFKRSGEESPLERRADGLTISRSNIIIFCGDSVDGNPDVTAKDVFDQIVNVTQTVSPWFGGLWYQAYYCPFWPVRAVERYNGPFNKTLKNPVLLIGDEADPATPFVGAQAVANVMGDNAVLVKENSFGHTSLAERSQCMIDIVKNYLLNGTLPSEGTACDVDSTFEVLPGVPGNTITPNITAGGGLVPTSSPTSGGKFLAPGYLTLLLLICGVLGHVVI